MKTQTVIGMIAFVLAGCGASDSSPRTVSGAVTFLGRPLANGTIVMTPDRDRGTIGKPIIGTLDSQGNYRISTLSLMPGWYRVSISDSPTWQAVEGFPASLRRPDGSGLVREIGTHREYRFDYHIDGAVR